MKTSKVFVNASWIIGCKILQSGLAVIITGLTARFFGPTNYGLISYAASLVAFVTPIMTLGTNDILVSELIQNPDKEGTILGTSMMMTFFSSLMCIVGLGIFTTIANPNDTTTLLVVLLYGLLLTAQSMEQIQYWFHAKFLSKVVSLTAFGVYIIISLYKVVLLVQKRNIYWFAISNSLDYFLIATVLLIIYKSKNGPRLRFSIEVAKILWDHGKHYIIPGLMGLVLAQSDRIMIRHMCGDTEVGFYATALYISGMTSFIFSAIVTSFRTAIVESKNLSQSQYESDMVKLYGIIVYLALIQAIVLSLTAKIVVGILYGQEYLPAVPMLRIVVWYTIFSNIGAVRAVWILAENKQRYLWTISFLGMVLNILLNLILIPWLRGEGAAIATLITQIFTNIILVYLIKPLRDNIRYILMSMDIRKIFSMIKQ